MIDNNYKAQVDLLLRILPFVTQEPNLALKGGTAINLFEWDMPRLSVDIDLVYLPFDTRDVALENISNVLQAISRNISKNMPDARIIRTQSKSTYEEKLVCSVPGAQVKLEVNTVMRGSVMPCRLMQVSNVVQQEFRKFAEAQVISRGELFGGKICASLDRQHPRDLFDVHYLLKNESITQEIKDGFIVALLSHNRPINEVLNPRFKSQEQTFLSQFQGMTSYPFKYEDLQESLSNLLKELYRNLTENDKQLLISFKSGEPIWSLSPIKRLKDLPAVQWKLSNIKKLKQENPAKHNELFIRLEKVLD